MNVSFENHLEKVIELSDQMLALAEEGESSFEDDDYGILCAILRDNAYRLRQLAEKQRQRMTEGSVS